MTFADTIPYQRPHTLHLSAMNARSIAGVVAVVRDRFDAHFVRLFDVEPDPAIRAVTNRVVSNLRRRPGEPHPADVYDAAWNTAKSQGADVFRSEDDGTEYLSDEFWDRAWQAAFAAAVAYEYPEALTEDESRLLSSTWEAALSSGAKDP
jgi:hypothetical protein